MSSQPLHLDGVGHWNRTFEHRCEITEVGASFWREVMIEEPHTADDE